MPTNPVPTANLYNEETQLNILDEIALKMPGTIDQKSNPSDVISIDMSDPVRAFNFNELYRKGYIEVYHRNFHNDFLNREVMKEESDYINNYKPELNVQCLTPEGHEFRYRLGLEVGQRRLQQEHEKRDRIRFRYDTLAVILSVIAIFLSIASLMLR